MSEKTHTSMRASRRSRISTRERLPRTNAAAPADARTFRDMGVGLSAVCSDVAFVDIVLKEAIVVSLRRVN